MRRGVPDVLDLVFDVCIVVSCVVRVLLMGLVAAE